MTSMAQAHTAQNPINQPVVPLAAGVLVGLVLTISAGIAVVWPKVAVLAIAGVVGAAFLPFAWHRGAFLLAAFTAVTATNITDVLIGRLGIPSPSKILLALLVLAFLRDFLTGRKPLKLDAPAGFLLILSAVVPGASLFWAFEPWETYYAWSALVREILVAALIVLYVRDFSTLRGATRGIVGGLALIGALGCINAALFQYSADFLGLAGFSIEHIAGKLDSHRFLGPYVDPNALGRSFLLAVPFALFEVMAARHIASRIVFIVALGFLLAGLTLTFSRGALLGLVAMLPILIWRYRSHMMKVIVYAVPIILLFLVALPQTYLDRASTILSMVSDDASQASLDAAPDDSMLYRLHEMQVGLEIFADHALVGAGYANQALLYQKYSLNKQYVLRHEPRASHSQIIQAASETGLVGLAAFLLLWCTAVWNARRAQAILHDIDPSAAGLSLVTLLALVGYFTASLFLHEAYPRLSWVVIGLALALPGCVAARLQELAVTQEGPR